MRTCKARVLQTLSLIICLVAGNASAVLPDSGWYWNPAESGRGFNIEIQDNVLFMAGFVYDAAGRPTWFATGGPMATDRTYSGAAFQTANGQPLGGAYSAPGIVPFGNATITFTTTTSANITVNGYSFVVTRQQFGFDFTSVNQPLFGELSFVEGTFGVYFANRVVLNGTIFNSTDGLVYATGHMTGDTSRPAVGVFSPILQMWTILLDSSPSYYTYFQFTFEGFNLVEGTSSTFLKGSVPSGSLPIIGFRTKSAQAAAGLNAPGTINSIAPRPTGGTDTYAISKVSAQVAKAPEPLQLETLDALEAALEDARQH